MEGDTLCAIGFPKTANFFMGLLQFLKRDKKMVSTSQSPYEAIGGEPVVKTIANRFYDIMETDPLLFKDHYNSIAWALVQLCLFV